MTKILMTSVRDDEQAAIKTTPLETKLRSLLAPSPSERY